VSLDRQDKYQDTRKAYAAFLERAPKRQSKMIITAQSRLKSLERQLAAEATAATP
jgi:hypothetical protein